MAKSASLFTNGGSQAVRLPADCRFDADRVYVRRDERSGDVILSTRPPSTLNDFIRLRAELGPIDEAADILRDRPMNAPTGLRDPFEQGQMAPQAPAVRTTASMRSSNEARERVEELEAALDQAVDYLDRLPRHPETSRVNARLAAARQGSGVSALTSRRSFVGTSFTRLGVPLMRVELNGKDLYFVLDTPSQSNKELLAALRAGPHVVRLRTLNPGEHWTDLEVERFNARRSDSR